MPSPHDVAVIDRETRESASERFREASERFLPPVEVVEAELPDDRVAWKVNREWVHGRIVREKSLPGDIGQTWHVRCWRREKRYILVWIPGSVDPPQWVRESELVPREIALADEPRSEFVAGLKSLREGKAVAS